MEVKLGIINSGIMGKWHASNDPQAGITIAAVDDIFSEKRHEAEKAGYKIYDSLEELLADKYVSTVIMTIPNHIHPPICNRAAKTGKNVINEKPAALPVAELDEMEDVCKKANVFFTVHRNHRWDKDILAAKKAIGEKLVGIIQYDWGVRLFNLIFWGMPDAKIKISVIQFVLSSLETVMSSSKSGTAVGFE